MTMNTLSEIIDRLHDTELSELTHRFLWKKVEDSEWFLRVTYFNIQKTEEELKQLRIQLQTVEKKVVKTEDDQKKKKQDVFNLTCKIAWASKRLEELTSSIVPQETGISENFTSLNTYRLAIGKQAIYSLGLNNY